MARQKTKVELENDVFRLEEENAKLKAAKAEFEKALQFATVVKQNLYDPAKTTSRTSISYTRYTKENIETYLQSPTNNEKNLRNASKYMWDISWHYRRLILYYSQLPKYSYVLTPFMMEAASIKEKTYRDSYFKAAKRVEIMNLKHEMERVNEIVFKEGIFFGIIVETKDTFFIQPINPDICTLSSKSDGCWNFAIDCSQIKESEIDIFYPPEIRRLWDEYNSSGIKLQEVPQEISFCIKADESVEGYSIPYFAGVMPNLYMIAEYEQLQQTSSEIENYKMIAGQIPLNEDGSPKIDWGLATQYYNHLCNALPAFIGAAITPFELQDFDFEQSNGVAGVDVVARSVENYWEEVGTPSAVHGAGTATATGLKYATKIDELIAIGIVKQEERAINRILKTISGTVKFKITILPITRLNEDEYIETYKDAASFGIAKSYYAAAVGLQPLDVANLSYIEENILGFADLVPMNNTYNTSDEALVGRPESDNPTDKTEENQEMET